MAKLGWTNSGLRIYCPTLSTALAVSGWGASPAPWSRQLPLDSVRARHLRVLPADAAQLELPCVRRRVEADHDRAHDCADLPARRRLDLAAREAHATSRRVHRARSAPVRAALPRGNSERGLARARIDD